MQELVINTPAAITLSDNLLAQQAMNGDQYAFETLVRRYSTPLFNFICHFLGDYDQACDVLQQVFLRLYTTLPRLSVGEPLKPWLFQVARNCCVDEVRRRRRHAIQFSRLEAEEEEGENQFLNEIPDMASSPEELVERYDLQQMLQKAIQSLPPKFRMVVLLRYAAQLSFAEIGRSLSIPEATAKTYFYRAKLLLRKILNPQVVASYR
ncbi:MAG: RNA polymerase sigma factor [Chloroflexi bacterium]|nr:MAG: RNA polymerase sigma factor [Chloroflexota bacterium]